MNDYFFQCKNDKDEIFNIILRSGAVKTVVHHALLVAHQLLRFDMELPQPGDVARACLLFAVKERNQSIGSSRPFEPTDDRNVVALELFLMQNMRRKSVLIESCLRIVFKELVDANRSLRECGEHILKVALLYVDHLYSQPYCLAPDSAARACVLRACEVLELSVEFAPTSQYCSNIVQEIFLFLQMVPLQ